MTEFNQSNIPDIDPEETLEWLESIDALIKSGEKDRAIFLLSKLKEHALKNGVPLPISLNTPYLNTIPPEEEPAYPVDKELERRVRSIIRWNAMAMVVRASRRPGSLGGHLASYQSIATLFEVGINHFFHARSANHTGDQVFFQGHSSPGLYARAYVEGRFTEKQMDNFRREFGETGGFSSYPHPRLMPTFWQFPTVSMGLGPMNAIYQARINRYLLNRGILDTSQSKVYCYVGDGEMDEPETTGALRLAAREHLDNLIFIVNCNLQRLDGPVRGNHKIIQEVESLFRGCGWDVTKVIWSSEWDELLKKDINGALLKVMEETLDGEYQKYSATSIEYVREHFFGKSPELQELAKKLSDEEIEKLGRGGHDPQKIYAALHRAQRMEGKPKVIIAKTIKGYGLGGAGEGKNIAHNQKKMSAIEVKTFKERFNLPIADKDVEDANYYRPAEDSPEMKYLRERRQALGGYIPTRTEEFQKIQAPSVALFDSLLKGSGGREQSTTFGFSRIVATLLKDKDVGKYIVPIIPDEARSFGMEGLFTQVGIYSPIGQLYEPVDKESGLFYYKEAVDGQIFEEGLNEAGAMSCFQAAGTAYSTHGVPLIPFFVYYSMFGFQRVGDVVWAAMDQKTKGFMVGGTSGRTTLNGEGLQHQDGHSQLVASTIPSMLVYDPAFNFELAVIIQDGIKRMYQDGEDAFYYISVYNEGVNQLPMPEVAGIEDGIRKGMYKFKKSSKSKAQAHLLSSGSMFPDSLKAMEILERDYNIAVDLWSVTSYKCLRTDCLQVERWNMINPNEKPKASYLQNLLKDESGVFVAVSDNMRIVAEQVSRWVPGGLHCLGTDGHGISDTRDTLRDYFEVSYKYQIIAVLSELVKKGSLDKKVLDKAFKDLAINKDKRNPLYIL